MAEPHVVTALIRKRAEIAGQLESAQTTVRQLIIDLERGMNTADKAIVRLIGKRIGSSLRTMRGKGLVRARDGWTGAWFGG